tara:strand:- start:726 stop:1004 length:279 start_codon:yes stop_codon:yes gene_type:complete
MIIRTLEQTRPNTGVEFYSPSDEVLTALAPYMKRDIQISTSEDNLMKSISIALSEEDHSSLSDSNFFNLAKDERDKHCNDNGIVFRIVETVE